jgi:hypothetical protein
MTHSRKSKKENYSGMVQLVITRTSKLMGGKDRTWEVFDEETKTFKNLSEARNWIKEQYGKAKKSPMFVDDKEGKTKKVGYIYGMKNYDWDRDTGKKVNYYQQDWIEFRAIKPLEV